MDEAVKDFLNVCNNKVTAPPCGRGPTVRQRPADWFADVVEPYGLHAVPQHYDDEPITKTYPGTILFIGGENEPTSAVDQDPTTAIWAWASCPR